jgi:hypothetical protein
LRGIIYVHPVMSMTLRILCMPDGAYKQVEDSLTLRVNIVFVRQWPGVGMKGLSHEVNADVVIGVAAGLANSDFNGLEGLENRDVIVATQEERPRLLVDGRMQQGSRKDARVAIGGNVGSGLQRGATPRSGPIGARSAAAWRAPARSAQTAADRRICDASSGPVAARKGAVREVLDSSVREIRNGPL